MTVENIPVYPSEQYLQTFTSGDSLNFTLLRGLQQLKKAVALMPLPEGYELAYTHRVFGFELRQGKVDDVKVEFQRNEK